MLWKYAHKKFRKEKDPNCRKRSSVIITSQDSSSKKVCPQDFYEDKTFNPYNFLNLTSNFFDADWVLEELRGKFDNQWNKVNFGEEVISEYIQFCENKKEFQPAFWHVVNLNLR